MILYILQNYSLNADLKKWLKSITRNTWVTITTGNLLILKNIIEIITQTDYQSTVRMIDRQHGVA